VALVPRKSADANDVWPEGETGMMRAVGPDDSPRMKIVARAHPKLVSFKRYWCQVFLGRRFPEEWPLEEWPRGGWVLHIPADNP
jgi:hypothetical protein